MSTRPAPFKTAVILLNYKGCEDTIACARSLLEGTITPWLLVVVDNASPDDSAQRINTWLESLTVPVHSLQASTPSEAARCVQELGGSLAQRVSDNTHGGIADTTSSPVLFIRSARNGGYAAGNNLGIAAALALGTDACWILNNDTVVDKAALAAMEERMCSGLEVSAGSSAQTNSADVGLCGSLVCYADGTERTQCCGGGYTNIWTGLSQLTGHLLPLAQAKQLPATEVEQGLNFVYGASVMASRDFLEKVGFMDERFFLYCEEQDWALAGAAQGFALAYAAGAVVYHKEGATTGMNQRQRSPQRLWQLTRSRLLLAWKHKPLAVITVAAGCGFAMLRLILRKFLTH